MIRGQARMLTESTSETVARWTLTKNEWFVAALLVVASTAMRSDAFERRCVRAAEDLVADSIRFDDVDSTTANPTTWNSTMRSNEVSLDLDET